MKAVKFLFSGTFMGVPFGAYIFLPLSQNEIDK
jgi:hypothetical protein